MKPWELTKGQKVIATVYGGEQRELIVWDVWKNLVYLCSESRFKALQSGSTDIDPIGFPIEDVQPFQENR